MDPQPAGEEPMLITITEEDLRDAACARIRPGRIEITEEDLAAVERKAPAGAREESAIELGGRGGWHYGLPEWRRFPKGRAWILALGLGAALLAALAAVKCRGTVDTRRHTAASRIIAAGE